MHFMKTPQLTGTAVRTKFTKNSTCLFALAGVVFTNMLCAAQNYTIVDTGQTKCYDNRTEIAPPKGDVIRIYNYVRLVRGGNVQRRTEKASVQPPATAPVRAEEPSEVPGGGAIGGPPQPTSPIIAALDSNGDGVIAEDEIKNSAAVLKKIDENGDGKLTSIEIRPLGMGGPGGHFERPGSGPRPAGRAPANRPPFDQNDR